MEINRELLESYDRQYTDAMTEWRELGGKYKAENILKVCSGFKFEKVLDCGAGEGSVLQCLDASGVFADLYAIEISSSAISQIQQRRLDHFRGVEKFNGYEIPYPDDTFDMAYCAHVIEHVEHPRQLLRELRRVSRFQVFEVPLDYCVDIDRKVELLHSCGHLNVFTPALFRFLLKSEGFEIVQDLLGQHAEEFQRFEQYRVQNLKKTWSRELAFKLQPFLRWLKRLKHGQKKFNEYCFSTYTCLTKAGKEVKIL